MDHVRNRAPSQPEGRVRIWCPKVWRQLPLRNIKSQELTHCRHRLTLKLVRFASFVASEMSSFVVSMWRNLYTMARFYLGLRELIHPQACRGRAVSRSNCYELPVIFSWITVKNKAPFKPSSSTFWIFLGLSWAFLPANPVPGPTGVPHPLPSPITFPVFSGWALPLYVITLVLSVLVQKFCYVTWFLLHLCPAEEFPLLLPLGIQYQAAALGRFSSLFWGLSLLGGSPLECVNKSVICSSFPAD